MAQPHILSFKSIQRDVALREKGRGTRWNDTGRYEPETREQSNEDWDALPEDDRVARKTAVINEHPKTIINKINSPYVVMPRSINPYRGCEHGCSYCFARPTHAYHGLSPGLDFETKLFAKPDAARLLTEALSKPRYKVIPIQIGTNTDAYQPIERERLIMRDIVQVLHDFNHPMSILTKNAMVLRDVDLLAPMAAKDVTRVMISITTQDRHLARAMEPRTSTPDKRFEAIRQLSDAGIPTGVMLGPMIPGLNDSELEGIMARASDMGATFSAFTILRLPQEVAPIFKAWLEDFAPNRARRILHHIHIMNNGRDYDPSWGRVTEPRTPFAKLITQRYRMAQKKYGMTPRQQRRPLRRDLFRIPACVSGQGDLF